MCEKNCHGEKGSDFEDLGFDRIDQLLLITARYYFASYTDHSYPHWETAFDFCNKQFGEFRGTQIAAGMLNVLRQMRIARQNTFHFTNPFCSDCMGKVSDCERLLISTIRHFRNQDRQAARMDALMLCEGVETRPILIEIEKLCALLPGSKVGVPSIFREATSLH